MQELRGSCAGAVQRLCGNCAAQLAFARPWKRFSIGHILNGRFWKRYHVISEKGAWNLATFACSFCARMPRHSLRQDLHSPEKAFIHLLLSLAATAGWVA